MYGVVPQGFNRKPIAVILAEIEAQLITEFGPDLVQTSASPMGQINGLFADLVGQLWEFAEDVYQSYDIEQSEGRRLEMLAKLRLLQRNDGEQDAAFRGAITNQGKARIDVQDITRAVAQIEGVTYIQVFISDGQDLIDPNGIPRGSVCVAVLGGDDVDIASTLRRYIVPGISTYGNTPVSTVDDGYCRSLLILRPILIPIKLTIKVRLRRDNLSCPPPSPLAIRDALVAELATGARRLINGDDISAYRVRSVVESLFDGVECVSVSGEREEIDFGENSTVSIGFIELATIRSEDVTVSAI